MAGLECKPRPVQFQRPFPSPLYQWFSTCGPQISRIRMTWKYNSQPSLSTPVPNRPTQTKTRGPNPLHFNKPQRWFLSTRKCENYSVWYHLSLKGTWRSRTFSSKRTLTGLRFAICWWNEREQVIQFDCELGLILAVSVSFLHPRKIPRCNPLIEDPIFRCRNQSHLSHQIIGKTPQWLVHSPFSKKVHITHLRPASDYLHKKVRNSQRWRRK